MDPIKRAFVAWYRRTKPPRNTPADAAVAAEFYLNAQQTTPDVLRDPTRIDVFQTLLDCHAVEEKPFTRADGIIDRVTLH
jgi:hypothetical protein